MTAETCAAEALADLIAHHDAYRVNDDGWTVCICGHVAIDDDDDGSHARHVAAVVSAAGCLRDEEADLVCVCGYGMVCRECRLAEKRAALRDDRQGETVMEWGVRATIDGQPHTGKARGSRWQALDSLTRLRKINGAGDGLVSRQRTRFPDVVTDWSPVTPDGCRWSSARQRWEIEVRPGVSKESCVHATHPVTPDGGDQPPACPECVNGKHVNCTREALDEATDEIVSCECACGGDG